jgi:surfeit locus 1 family protein
MKSGTRWNVAFLVASVAMAVLFVRLGVWQLHRLGERRAKNATVLARLAIPPVPLSDLPRDTALAKYRRVRVAGTYDFAHEVVLTGRTREGSPGVHVVTPMRQAGSDSEVLVDRGWVYSPDASHVDQLQWREPLRVDTTGYVETFAHRAGAPSLPGRTFRLRWLEPDTVALAAGHPIARFFVVLDGDTSASSFHVPARVPPPPLDEGPHMSYAIQWFSFAVIAVVGAGIAVFGPATRSPLIDLPPSVGASS